MSALQKQKAGSKKYESLGIRKKHEEMPLLLFLFPQLRRQHIRDAVVDGIVLLEFAAIQRSLQYLNLILFSDFKHEFALAHRTAQDIPKVSFHFISIGSTPKIAHETFLQARRYISKNAPMEMTNPKPGTYLFIPSFCFNPAEIS